MSSITNFTTNFLNFIQNLVNNVKRFWMELPITNTEAKRKAYWNTLDNLKWISNPTYPSECKILAWKVVEDETFCVSHIKVELEKLIIEAIWCMSDKGTYINSVNPLEYWTKEQNTKVLQKLWKVIEYYTKKLSLPIGRLKETEKQIESRTA